MSHSRPDPTHAAHLAPGRQPGAAGRRMKLIIFDFDQTLVDFMPVHDEATDRLFQAYFNVRAKLTDIDFTGKSLLRNFIELAARKGIPEDAVSSRAEELLRKYDENFVAALSSGGSGRVLPGVRELLDALRGTRYHLALYTGGSTRIVQAIFERAGLGMYFKVVVTSNDAPTRPGMVRLVMDRVGKLTGATLAGADVVIVGDSVRDVETGRAVGARTIAVATGYHPGEMLAKAGADYVFSDLRDTEQVLRIIAILSGAGEE